ncbi:MAG: hypothetical protein AAFY25_08150, partial [Pseudomonadota bacterium]
MATLAQVWLKGRFGLVSYIGPNTPQKVQNSSCDTGYLSWAMVRSFFETGQSSNSVANLFQMSVGNPN